MQRHIFSCVCLLLCCIFTSTAQTSKDDFFNSTNLEAAYSYNFGEPNSKDFHILSVGINKLGYGGRHGGGFSYGVGTDFVINKGDFTFGPKIMGILYYQFIVIGSEFVTYTNFDNFSLRYVPMIGIGGEKFRLTFNPQIILTNKEYQPVNKGSVQLSVNFTLAKKLRKRKN